MVSRIFVTQEAGKSHLSQRENRTKSEILIEKYSLVVCTKKSANPIVHLQKKKAVRESCCKGFSLGIKSWGMAALHNSHYNGFPMKIKSSCIKNKQQEKSTTILHNLIAIKPIQLPFSTKPREEVTIFVRGGGLAAGF